MALFRTPTTLTPSCSTTLTGARAPPSLLTRTRARHVATHCLQPRLVTPTVRECPDSILPSRFILPPATPRRYRISNIQAENCSADQTGQWSVGSISPTRSEERR